METTIEHLLEKLAMHGGHIVNTAQCSEMEIAFAKAERRMYVDARGIGYVWRQANVIKTEPVKAWQNII